jgi:hypothetical protein
MSQIVFSGTALFLELILRLNKFNNCLFTLNVHKYQTETDFGMYLAQ